MESKFCFGDRSTADYHMRIERFPGQPGAVRRRQTFIVPGRNGALHATEDAFDNFAKSYQCYFHGDFPTPAQTHAIKSWLQCSGAYQKLQDTYDPDHYWLATFAGPLDVENVLNKYGRCVVTFDCAPQAWLVSGDQICTYSVAGAIYNPTAFTAKPMITIYGTGAGTVTVGTETVKINSILDQIILDCDAQNAYRQVGDGAPENYNGNIYAPSFPELRPGENSVSFTGDITKVEIIPRWWEL